MQLSTDLKPRQKYEQQRKICIQGKCHSRHDGLSHQFPPTNFSALAHH